MADLATKDQDRSPVASSDKVWGDAEAERAGLYEPGGKTAPGASADVLPKPTSPTEQALGLDSQTSAYGVKARQLQQDQLNATRTANAAGDARNERYLRMMEDQYKATGLQQGELPKWDAKKEREQFQTDPIQAFGSMASVFGILASAFTHAPLTNALNASSAAMNAIRQGDEKGYNEAFDAWKENTLLTYKRHEVEQQRFNDATRLLDTNWKLGEAKMRATAVEFGMQSELAMMDSGMWPELFKLQQSKMDAAAGMLRASDTLTNERFKNDLFKQWESAADEEFKGDPNKQAGARLSFAMARNAINSSSPEWQAIGDQIGQWQSQVMHSEHRIPTIEEVSAKIRELKEATSGRIGARESVDQEWLRLWDNANPNATAEDRSAAFDQHLASKRPQSSKGPSLSGMHAQTLEETIKEVRAQHPEWPEGQTRREAEKRVKEANASPVTGNQKLKEEVRIDELGNATTLVDKIDKTIGKYTLPVGVPGSVLRAGERISNLAGFHQTDRVQLERDITLLKSMAPKLLFGRDGRPLHEDSNKIDRIVAGLSMGDTTANTLRAMKTLREWFVTLQQQNMRRLDETWQPPAGQPAPAKRNEGSSRWMSAPITQSAQ